MTKKEARAILGAQRKILGALETLSRNLSERELEYANAYWLGHTSNIWNGQGYGSVPIARAEELVNPDQ